jgi:hypothetical protein
MNYFKLKSCEPPTCPPDQHDKECVCGADMERKVYTRDVKIWICPNCGFKYELIRGDE